MIKPIETIYNGYKFRSRLEARWAVFFDAMGIPWEYEPEGFQMSDGTQYLPDFYLPEADEFFEVKGVMSDKDMHKIERFMDESSKPVVVGYEGMKFKAPMLMMGDDDKPILNDDPPNEEDMLCICRECGHVYFMSYVGIWACPYCKVPVGKDGYFDICSGNNGLPRSPWENSREERLERLVYEARDKAKQARFERREHCI